MFCCTLLYVHSSIAIILMGKRELVALLNLSSWCLVMVERLFLAVPWGCLRFVIVVFLDHTQLLFFYICYNKSLPLYLTIFSFLMFPHLLKLFRHLDECRIGKKYSYSPTENIFISRTSLVHNAHAP